MGIKVYKELIPNIFSMNFTNLLNLPLYGFLLLTNNIVVNTVDKILKKIYDYSLVNMSVELSIGLIFKYINIIEFAYISVCVLNLILISFCKFDQIFQTYLIFLLIINKISLWISKIFFPISNHYNLIIFTMIMEFILGLWFGYWVQILCLTIKILLVIQINHFINYIPDILIYKSVQFINLLENSKKRLDSVDTKIMIWLSNSYKNSIVNNKNEKIFQMTNNKVSENVQNLLSVIEKYKRKYQWNGWYVH